MNFEKFVENFKNWFYIEQQGIGWSVLKFLLFAIISVFIWYIFDRETYIDINIQMVNEDEYQEFILSHRVDILYDYSEKHKDSNYLNMRYVLISKESSEIDNIKVLEYNPENTKYNSTDNYDKWYEEVFNELKIKESAHLFPVPPSNYIALHIPITENLPMYRYQVMVDDYSITMDANSSGRYGISGNKYSKVKGKQSFFTFLKSKVVSIFK